MSVKRSDKIAKECFTHVAFLISKRSHHPIQETHTLALTFAGNAQQWVPEITHHRPEAPYVLVGTKSDLREDGPATEEKVAEAEAKLVTKFVTDKKIRHLAHKVGAYESIECSALTGANVKQVFDLAVTAALDPTQLWTKHRRCRVM
eukprot:m.32598 g.32598  ORF g.32598 m.32598 type:complete len:147 (-) comp10074_c0_seq2:45-485(-)